MPSASDDSLLNISSLDDESNSPTSAGTNAEQQPQPIFLVSETGTISRGTATSSAAGPNADTSQNNNGKVETNLSPPTSLVEMDPNLLRQMLGYAQPEEHHHRFEWSGIVGRTCRTFHRLSHEDSEWNRATVFLNSFDKYVSIARTNSKSDSPRDLSVALLRRLENDESMRSRVKELIYWRLDQLHDKDVLTSLKSLLSQPESFPNLTGLDIIGDLFCHGTEDSKFELINSRRLLALPAALPKLERLWLCGCILSSVPGARNLCTTAEASREDLIQFATMLKTPLRHLDINPAPWMGDDDVDALLAVLGKDLERLDLSNDNRLHQKHGRHINLDNEIPVSHRSLLSIAKHCSNLRHLSIVLQSSPNQRSDTNDLEESLKLVLDANKELSNSSKEYVVKYEKGMGQFMSLRAFGKKKG